MKAKRLTKHLDHAQRWQNQRQAVSSRSPTCVQEIAHDDGEAERMEPKPTIRKRIPGWTEEELLGLAFLLAIDELKFENYRLYHQAKSRLRDSSEETA